MAGLELHGGHGAPAFLRGGKARALGPRIAEWALIALIAFLLARAAIAFFAPLPVPAGDQLAALPATSKTSAGVEGRNPFPEAAVATATVEAGPDLAETALDLTLTGVWPEAAESSAIIQRPDGKQRRFAVGDEIVPGVRLIAVYSDQVVIEQNGVRESLRFESKAPLEREARPAHNAAAQAQDQTTPDETKIENRPASNALSTAFRIEPGRDPAGNPAIIFYAGRNRAAFEAAGLKDGDILRSVNGSPPPMAPNELAVMISQFMKSGAATLVVERNGALETIELSKDG